MPNTARRQHDGRHDTRARARAPRALARWLVLASLVALGAPAADDAARAAADGMNVKIERLGDAAERPRTERGPPARTSFSDYEMNAYLHFYGPTFLPPGITDPQVAFGERGRISARAIVDLDAVRLARRRSLLDPLAFVTGALEVIATGFVEGNEGVGLVRLESATVGGVAVPRSVAEELLRFYTRTPERPDGFELDRPFALPGAIRGVSTARGSATVVH